MAGGMTLKAFLQNAAARTDAYATAYLDTLADTPAKLREAMAYSLLGPGKRIRPALVLLCYQAAGGKDLDSTLPAAVAMEMIHCFSLIHDDLPAMDNDDLRRGRPTNHKVYGDALAILAGDALNTLPFELIATRITDPTLAVALMRELAQATGAMIGGQVLDTCHPEQAKAGQQGTLADLQRIHRMKTGALIKSSCRMGGMCAAASPEQLAAIDTYGRAIGLAFQIVDDILDVTATEEVMGKKTGKDAAIGKLTYPSLVGLDSARTYLAEQVKIAETAAAQLGSEMMAELVHELASRTK